MKRLNDSESRLYDLTLEENSDGVRTRALLRLYDVEEDTAAGDEDPELVVKSSYGWWNEEFDRLGRTDCNFRGDSDRAGPDAGYHEVK